MRHKVLVVDDNPTILSLVSGILDSLGHEYDLADSQMAGQELLQNNTYSYVLLDLQLPVRSGDVDTRIETGKNMLREIREEYGDELPVIIMTSHAARLPELGAEMIKLGATDYVAKPFDTTSSLEKAIARATNGQQKEQALGRFIGGTLEIQKNRIQLDGVTIASARGLYTLQLLQLLCRKGEDGRFVSFLGGDLAAEIDAENGIRTVTSCIYNLRRNIQKRMAAHRKVACGYHDVIENNEQGYFLRDWINVRFEGDPTDETVDFWLNERHEWVLAQLRRGVRLTRATVERKFRISMSTAARCLSELTEHQLIKYVRSNPGYYQLT